MYDRRSKVSGDFSCGVCGSSADAARKVCPVTLGSDTVYDLVECGNCATRQLFPMPTDAALKDFYNTGYYGLDWYKQRGSGRTFAKWYIPPGTKGSLLDVGCSLGYFLDGVRSVSGWEVYGTEFSRSAVEHADRELGIKVFEGGLANIDFGGRKFDFIRISNVLEHVRDPVAVLSKCRAIITENGRLRLSVPNGSVDSLGLENFFSSEGIPPRSKDGHLYFFPARALHRMFEMTGFRVVSARTCGIRRGLRSLGRYPQKSNWKAPYFDHGPTPNAEDDISLANEKRRPDLYYHFRRALLTVKMLPGFRDFGLDFKIMLEPISQ